MRRFERAVLPLALLMASVPYAGVTPSWMLTGQPGTGAREGSIDAGGGVRLFYRTVGTGRDTVVVLHGGPGFIMSYLAADLEPLAERHVLLARVNKIRSVDRFTIPSTIAEIVADPTEIIGRVGLAASTAYGHGAGPRDARNGRFHSPGERSRMVGCTA